MAKSGYDAVYEQLFRIPAVRGMFNEAMETWKNQKYLRTRFTAGVRTNYTTYKQETYFSTAHIFTVGDREIVSDSNIIRLDQVLNKKVFIEEALGHFGKDKEVKTRNCKQELVSGEDNKKGIQSFWEWMMSKMHDPENRIIRDDLVTKHEEQAKAYGKTEEAKQAKAEGVGKFLKDKLLEHLKPWAAYDLSGEISMDEILHNAWMLVKAETVIEL